MKTRKSNSNGKLDVLANGWIRLFFVSAVILAFLSGCSHRHIQQAENYKKNKKYEEALEHYFKALKTHPDNIELKIEIDRTLKEASAHYFDKGQVQETEGLKKKAVFFYKKSLEFDPGNSRVRQVLKELVQGDKTVKTIAQIKKEMEINTGLPKIFKSSERMDLEFRTPTSLMAIFGVLAKTGKVNILFDSEFKDQPVKIKLQDITFYDALEYMCRLFKSSYYILNDKNIIITPDSKDSKKRYKKLLVKNIFFSNVQADDAKKVIEKIFRPERLVWNEMSNSLIVTDSLENIALIEKLAQFIDKRKGEVEIEIEIMELNERKLREYGSELSAWQVSARVDGTESGIGINELDTISSNDVIISIPQMVWKLFSSITDSKILSRPKLRGLDKEKIKIQVGERRPIPRTTFVPVSSGGVNQQPITSFTMTDVGISVTITPTIHHNREVTLDFEFELTNVIDIGTTFTPPTLGSRKVTSKLRLRDGETGIIAGLIKGSSTGSSTGIPILNRIPLIKELFSSNSKFKERTDILISITPRILRMPEITRQDVDAYFIGTGEKVELKKWEGYKIKNSPPKKTKKPKIPKKRLKKNKKK